METVTENLTIDQALERTNRSDTPMAIKEFFINAEVQAQQWADQSKQIVVKDWTDTQSIAQARKARLELRAIRIMVEKKHEELKADALEKGRTLDLIKRTLIGFITPIESELLDKEQFVERAESQRKLDLFMERMRQLQPFRSPGDGFENMPFGEMPQDAFDHFISTQQAGKEMRERQAAEKAKAEQDEKDRKEKHTKRLMTLMGLGFFYSDQYKSFIRIENDPDGMNIGHHEFDTMSDEKFDEVIAKFKVLIKAQMEADKEHQQQAEELAAKLLREKKEAEDKAKKERDKRLKLEREQREREAKVEADRKAKAAADRKARRAPDKEKLLLLADQLNDFQLPLVTDNDAKAILTYASGLIDKVANYIRSNAENL